MLLFPDRDAFVQSLSAGIPQILWSSMSADLLTPVATYLNLVGEGQTGFLLESVERGANRGRYSIVGTAPDLIWRCLGGRAELFQVDESGAELRIEQSDAVLESLRKFLKSTHLDIPDELPSMACGAFGYLGFDMIRFSECLSPPKPDPVDLPLATLMRPRLVAIFDSVTDTVNLVSPAWPGRTQTPEQAYEDARARLAAAAERLSSSPSPHSVTAETPVPADFEVTSNTTPARYRQMVEAAKDHIRAGDIFQVVLSQRFSCPIGTHPFALYRALRRSNPSPFMYYLDLGSFQIVGSSPEILVRLQHQIVTIRPIAGTRARGRTKDEDNALARELLDDPKERAEHLMLLDLGRNDVGRVAAADSVTVTESHSVERYSHVMHMVSNVEGRLRQDLDALDALLGGFPAGTVSGAPKLRAIEIIDDLESEARGPYAGAVGYFSADGSMDTCIVLRTAVIKDGIMHVQAGAGIVADSDPESEYQECRNKARALFHAASLAKRQE